MTTTGSGSGSGTPAAGATPGSAPKPSLFSTLSTPAKGLLISTLAAAGLGILVASSQKGTGSWPFTQGNSWPFTQGNFGYNSTRTYDSHSNMYTDTFQTGGGERRIQTPGGEIADRIATEFGLAEADYGPMTIAQRQKAYLLIDQDGSGMISRYEADCVARDVIRRICRDAQRDY